MKCNAVVFVPVLLASMLIGCQSSNQSYYASNDLQSFRDKKIESVLLKNGELHKYNSAGGKYIEEVVDSGVIRKIVGFDEDYRPSNYDLRSILEIRGSSSETDVGGTVLLVALLSTVGAYLLLLLAFTTGGSFH